MKRLVLLIVVMFALVTGQVLAQDTNPVVTLSDSNPSVTAAINLAPNTTGVVAVDLSMAAVTLTDANGGVVFSSVDPRVHHLELSIVPNTGSHTLTIQRLPGAALASAQIGAQATLTLVSPTMTTLVDTQAARSQQQSLSLDPTHPAGQVALDIQPDTTGLVTASFPGAGVTSQLTDSSGMLIATSARDIDGLNMLLDGGQYDLNVQANALTSGVSVPVSTTASNQFNLLSIPQPQTDLVQTSGSTPCTATVATSSVNLRSGPGTGYSVLDAASQGDTLAVGGVNPEQNWVVVGTNGGSAWVERDLAQLDGDCAQLQVFNIPLRSAQTAPIIVQSAPSNPAPVIVSAHHEDDGASDDHSQRNSGGDQHESSGGDD